MTAIPDFETAPLISSPSVIKNRSSVVHEISDIDHSILAPAHWKAEAKLITRYSAPLIFTYLLQYSYQLTTVAASSRLSTTKLAAVSLGISTTIIVGFAIFEGMATSLDTLCAQAYGSGNPRLVGLHMLRFIIFVLVVAIPVGDLALLAGSFLRYSVVGLPGYAIFEAGKRFMQARGNFTASLMVLIVCAPTNILLTWLLVFPLQLGVQGAALAAAITNTLRPILLILYALFIAPETLQYWASPVDLRRQLFCNWSPMISLSIPGVVMTLCEWFGFEILTFTTSYVSTADLAAQTFLATSAVLIWHIPFAMSVAISTRIGQLIRADEVDAARKVTRLYAHGFALIGLVDMVLQIALNNLISRGLAVDDEVRRLVAGALPFVVLFQFFDATICCAHGVVRWLGWQSIGGWTTLTVNYIYAVPFAVFLELGPAKLGIRGVWLSLASGMCIITCVESLVIQGRDWERSAQEAKSRKE